MILRRELLQTAIVGGTILSATRASACSLVDFDDDVWGKKLISYLKSGQDELLDPLFHDFTTLVAFEPTFLQPNMTSKDLLFSGRATVKRALQDFRNHMLKTDRTVGRELVAAQVVGNKQQGRMNRIELLFADSEVEFTSCGPGRNEWPVDLYYQAGVYEIESDSQEWAQEWAIERLAIMPRLDLERAND